MTGNNTIRDIYESAVAVWDVSSMTATELASYCNFMVSMTAFQSAGQRLMPVIEYPELIEKIGGVLDEIFRRLSSNATSLESRGILLTAINAMVYSPRHRTQRSFVAQATNRFIVEAALTRPAADSYLCYVAMTVVRTAMPGIIVAGEAAAFRTVAERWRESLETERGWNDDCLTLQQTANRLLSCGSASKQAAVRRAFARYLDRFTTEEIQWKLWNNYSLGSADLFLSRHSFCLLADRRLSDPSLPLDIRLQLYAAYTLNASFLAAAHPLAAS